MSLLDRIEKPERLEEIEPGKRLIRAADDRGVALAARLAYRLHRLGLRSPLHAFRLRGRFPLKLLAVPKDPVAGDKTVGEAILRGTIAHGGYSAAIQSLRFTDPSMPQALADHLHSFAWLRDLAAAATREKGARIAEHVAKRWLADCGGTVGDPAWRADLWGRRILFWTAYAPYLLSSRDMVYRSAMLNALARGARHIDRSAAKTAEGLPRISAWAGMIAASLVIQGGPARLSRGEAGLTRALDESLHDDGGLVSRAPTEQIALVELLGQLRAVYLAARRDMPEPLTEAIEGSVAALLAVTLGDEALSSWQGGNMLSRRRVKAAVEGSGVDARPLRQSRGWGYQRLVAKGGVVVMDAAPPPPSRALSGGCASTLAFEFSDGPDRLIVNCGGVGEHRGALSDHMGRALRATAAHSTLTLGDRNSSAIQEDGSIGKGVTQVELSRDETAGVVFIEASHDGYVRRFGLVHQRQLILQPSGFQLEGEDRLVPQGPQAP